MPPNVRRSNRIRSPVYRKKSINTGPSRRVQVEVSWLEKRRNENHGYYGRYGPDFTVLDSQTIGNVLDKIRKKLIEEYPVLVHGFVLQLNYHSRRTNYTDSFDTTIVQITPTMSRNVKLSSLRPRGHRFEYIDLRVLSVKGSTKKITDRLNPGVSYRPSDVFTFKL